MDKKKIKIQIIILLILNVFDFILSKMFIQLEGNSLFYNSGIIRLLFIPVCCVFLMFKLYKKEEIPDKVKTFGYYVLSSVNVILSILMIWNVFQIINHLLMLSYQY